MRPADKLERLNYVSTAYVAGTRTGTVYEHELIMGQQHKNHYESTKFQAEVWVREYLDKVPTTIYRPAIVVGDSQTGETQKFDGPYYILRTFQRMGRAPLPQFGRSEAPFNVVPVDFIVDAIAAAAGDEAAVGETLHLVDPEPVTAAELFKALAHEYTEPRAQGPRTAQDGGELAALRPDEQGVPRRAARVDPVPQPPGALRHPPRGGPARPPRGQDPEVPGVRWSDGRASSASTRTTRRSRRPDEPARATPGHRGAGHGRPGRDCGRGAGGVPVAEPSTSYKQMQEDLHDAGPGGRADLPEVESELTRRMDEMEDTAETGVEQLERATAAAEAIVASLPVIEGGPWVHAGAEAAPPSAAARRCVRAPRRRSPPGCPRQIARARQALGGEARPSR